jgi:hypothetical protein
MSISYRWLVVGVLVGLLCMLARCKREVRPAQVLGDGSTAGNVGEAYFRNLHDTVKYVGMQTCRSCHADKYETFVHTGMGESFGLANRAKSAANFGDHALVYDKNLDLYYKPYLVGDTAMYVMEYRLEGKDTVHKRVERVDYVIGSGHHTNSHLMNEGGYVYQVPITFYTQEKRWDLAPGFENGGNTRFGRIIATECMTCHNHLPEQVVGSQNKYKKVPLGIECERCHGPGAIHVREKMLGKLVDTARYTDYSIVNPRKLTPELEMDVCQRCHLQGVAVLNEGKSFYDFRPGMPLNSVMNVFLPRYTNSSERFIMASQADRLRLSACYRVGKATCTTCHNPHKSVRTTAGDVFNAQCRTCHTAPKNTCTETETVRMKQNNNCTGCHMPKVGSIDIPHVRVTDHNIGKPITTQKKQEVARFLGLECLTQPKPSPLLMASGYLATYDKFVPDKMLLDSAAYYLSKADPSAEAYFKIQAHFLFTKDLMPDLATFGRTKPAESLQDAWTAYRIGEALYQQTQFQQAAEYYQRAVTLLPYELDFNNKLGISLIATKNLQKARTVFEFILSENKKYERAICNLGYICALEGKLTQAETYYLQAIALNPDYEQAWINLLGLRLLQKNLPETQKLIQQLRKKFPNNKQAYLLEQQLKDSRK